MPFGILNKEIVLSQVNVHFLTANRTIWNQFAGYLAVGGVFQKLTDQFLIFIQLIVTCLAALQESIIPLCCKNPFVLKSIQPKLMVHIGCYDKMLLACNQP